MKIIKRLLKGGAFMIFLFCVLIISLYLMGGCSMLPSTTNSEFKGAVESVTYNNTHWSTQIWVFGAGTGVGLVVGWWFLRRPKLFRRVRIE